MSPLNRLERRLRQLVEGAFARVGGEGVQPIEIAQALSRELSERRLVGVSGAFVPNCFRVGLCPADWQRLEPFAEVIRAELEEFVSRQADEFGAQLAGPVQVDLGPGAVVPTGQLELTSQAVAAQEAAGSADCDTGAFLRVISGPRRGERLPIPPDGATLGRDPECELSLPEPSASRRHAEITPQGRDFRLRDLGSTNGTLINNQPVEEQRLVPGDVIAIGATLMEFERVRTV